MKQFINVQIMGERDVPFPFKIIYASVYTWTTSPLHSLFWTEDAKR